MNTNTHRVFLNRKVHLGRRPTVAVKRRDIVHSQLGGGQERGLRAVLTPELLRQSASRCRVQRRRLEPILRVLHEMYLERMELDDRGKPVPV